MTTNRIIPNKFYIPVAKGSLNGTSFGMFWSRVVSWISLKLSNQKPVVTENRTTESIAQDISTVAKRILLEELKVEKNLFSDDAVIQKMAQDRGFEDDYATRLKSTMIKVARASYPFWNGVEKENDLTKELNLQSDGINKSVRDVKEKIRAKEEEKAERNALSALNNIAKTSSTTFEEIHIEKGQALLAKMKAEENKIMTVYKIADEEKTRIDTINRDMNVGGVGTYRDPGTKEATEKYNETLDALNKIQEEIRCVEKNLAIAGKYLSKS